MRRMLARVVLPLMIIAMGVVRGGQAYSQPGCEPGAVCLYQDSGYSGLLALFFGDGDVSYVGDDVNDRTSSAYNNTGAAVVLFSDPNFGGSAICLNPGTGIEDLGAVG